MIFVKGSRPLDEVTDSVIQRTSKRLSEILQVPRVVRTEKFGNFLALVDCTDDGEYIFEGECFAYLYGNPWCLLGGARKKLDCRFFLDQFRDGYCPNELNIGGQFFVVFARATGGFLVLSDVCGSYPLFFFERDGFVFLSAFVDLIRSSSGFDINLDSLALQSFNKNIRFGQISTVYKDVIRVAPGLWSSHPALLSPKRLLVEAPEKNLSYSFAIDIAMAAIPVEARFLHDSVAALCLSGGLDSSLIALLLLRNGIRFSVYSGVFPDLPCDESKSIEKFLKGLQKLGHSADSTTVQLKIDSGRAEECYESSSSCLDYPLFPMSVMRCEIVRRAYSEGARVLFDGNGGDEIFAIPATAAITNSSYHHRDVLVALARNFVRRPNLRTAKKILGAMRTIICIGYEPPSDLESLIGRRYRPQAVLHPFYAPLWQFCYLNGMRLVQPFRCGLLAKYFLSQSFSKLYFADGYFRGLERAMISRMSNGIKIDPYLKVNFNSFTSIAYKPTSEEEAMISKMLGTCEIARYSWLVPRFIKRKQNEGYPINE
jgi:hypothetical protein